MTAASIVTPILERSATNPALRKLLAMRHDHPAAAPRLARFLGTSQRTAQRIQLGFEAAGDGHGFNSSRDAIEQSGYRVVHSVSVACVVVDSLALQDRWPEHDEFWIWAYMHSTVASILGEAAGRHQDAAFSATLLRNLGHLLIERSRPEAHADVRNRISNGVLLVEAERAVLGFTHLDVMRELAAGWDLDASVMPVFDEQPEQGSVGRLFWKAKRSLHRERLRDPFDPIDLSLQPLDPELHNAIEGAGGIRGALSWAAGYIAAAFVEGNVPDRLANELIAPGGPVARGDDGHRSVA